MRWNDAKLSFTRPVRWLVALLGDQVVPVSVSTLGRRPDHPGAPERRAADGGDRRRPRGTSTCCRIHGIEADPRQAPDADRRGGTAAGRDVGGTVDVEGESALIDQIVNLVEEPTAILGSFSPDYLELPAEILTTVMRKHQRYLPVRDADGKLLPHFVAVANGSVDEATVRSGNEGVLRARYEDASLLLARRSAEAPRRR